MRSRVHLPLCWIAGNALWLDDFPQASEHVTGAKFELLPGAPDVRDVILAWWIRLVLISPCHPRFPHFLCRELVSSLSHAANLPLTQQRTTNNYYNRVDRSQ
jgi:hypothetical protein